MAAKEGEKKELELQAASQYGGIKTDEANGVTANNLSDEREESSSTSGGSDILEEDEVKSKWFIKLFPCLLKWNWFRKRFYKRKTQKGICNLKTCLLYIFSLPIFTLIYHM